MPVIPPPSTFRSRQWQPSVESQHQQARDDVLVQIRDSLQRLESKLTQPDEVDAWLRLLRGRFVEDAVNRTVTIDLAEIHRADLAAYARMVKHFAGEAEGATLR